MIILIEMKKNATITVFVLDKNNFIDIMKAWTTGMPMYLNNE